MKDVRNTAKRPLRVPLPKGGVLHLGPLRTGQIADSAIDHPPLKKLVDAGDLEILGEGKHESRHPIKESTDHAQTHVQGGGGKIRSTGDR